MIHVLKCCVNEQVSFLAVIMDWCCALHFYLLLCTLTSQRSENRHFCVWVCKVMNVWGLQCCKKAQFHFLWLCITTEGKVCFYWAFRFHWSQVRNLYGLANLQSSCLWSSMGVTHLHNLAKLPLFCPLTWSLSFKLISVKILSQLSLVFHGVLIGWVSAVSSPVNENLVLVCDSGDWIFPHNENWQINGAAI